MGHVDQVVHVIMVVEDRLQGQDDASTVKLMATGPMIVKLVIGRTSATAVVRVAISREIVETVLRNSDGGGSYSRSPSPQRGRSRSHSFRRSCSYSQSPLKRERLADHSRSPHRRSPKRLKASSPVSSRGRKRGPSLDDRSPQGRRDSLSPGMAAAQCQGLKIRSPIDEADRDSPREGGDRSPMEENGGERSTSPVPMSARDEDDVYLTSPKGSE